MGAFEQFLPSGQAAPTIESAQKSALITCTALVLRPISGAGP